jgi:serine/threonine protein kinase
LPRLFGSYELQERIAQGGMGVVYKARDLSWGRLVALKMIRADRLTSPAAVQRFHREARAAAKLDHKAIVPIYEIGEIEGRHYFTMALVSGGNLQQRLASGPLAPFQAARLVQEVAEAIQYAHDNGVIHRDLKPHNILLQVEERTADSSSLTRSSTNLRLSAIGMGLRPRLTDFGLAQFAEPTDESEASVVGRPTRAVRTGQETRPTTDTSGSPSVTGEAIGTPSYMPPEQAAGDWQRVGRHSDIYSLGAVLYCLLTGRPPFQASDARMTLFLVLNEEPVSPRKLNPGVPIDLETVCLKCLAKNPERRYASAGDLAEELERFQLGHPVLARPVSWPGRGWRWCRHNPLVAALSAAVAVLLVLGSVLGWFLAARANQAAARARDEVRRAEAEAARAREAQNMAWGPDGKMIVSVGADQAVRLRDATTGQLLATIPARAELVTSVGFSPDGKMLAGPGRDNTLALWDTATGRELRTLAGHTGRVRCVRFSPDGKRVVSAGEDKTVRVWDALTGRETLTLREHTCPVLSVAFSPDGKHIGSAGSDRTIIIWEAETGQALLTLPGNKH